MKNNYKIAGHVFNIDTIYADVHLYSKDYLTEEKPEFFIKTALSDIEEEKKKTLREYKYENIPYVEISDGSFENLSVYRSIAKLLFPFNFLLFHGSVVSVDNNAYMFIAKSGTGKSTHSRMWRELLGLKAVMVNDDKPLVKITKDNAIAYGTPWNGKHHLGNNISVPLKGICILKRGKENKIKQISITEAYPMLLQQIYRIPDKTKLGQTMGLLDLLECSVKFYEMECNISTDAAKMAYNYMSREE